MRIGEDAAFVDFESDAIRSRPDYPPKPVGVAIKLPGGKREYFAWGHPEGNNCEIAEARRRLKEACQAKRVVYHHAAFDMDLQQTYMGLPIPRRYEDTLFLAFLNDPYSLDLGLKPLGERDLDIAPNEQQELKEWIIDNIPAARKKQSTWGEYIGKAPGGLVGKYAISDIRTTERLYCHYKPIIKKRGMLEAYERELKVAPITLEMERSGVRVDRKRLKKCKDVFYQMDKDVLRRIAKALKLDPKNMKSDDNPKGFNLNSGDQLGDAMLKARKLENIIKTPTGKISTKIDNLRLMCTDKKLIDLLSVHSVVSKYTSTFIEPWLSQADKSGGRILPKFNQVRGYDDGGGGARSGRFSSSDPNMQQISSNVEESKNKETLLVMQKWLKDDYHFPFIGMRDFILPDEDCVMICIDYNQQELRLLAHFEKGVLMRAFLENPDLDIHEYCRKLVKDAIGIDFPRKHIKITVFGIVYGMGVGKLAGRLEVDSKTAKKVRDGILTAVPGISRLMKELKMLANHDEALRTWGGREYFCEEPRYDAKRGHWMSFEYKMLNYLIQPSAADYTKQGMINVREEVPDARIAIQVHDELVCMAKNKSYGELIKRAMCRAKLKVPMRAEAKYSTKTWARAA